MNDQERDHAEQELCAFYKTLRIQGRLTKERILDMLACAEDEVPTVVYDEDLYKRSENYREIIAKVSPAQVVRWNADAEEAVVYEGEVAKIGVTFRREPNDETATSNFAGIAGLSEKAILMLQLMFELQDTYGKQFLRIFSKPL